MTRILIPVAMFVIALSVAASAFKEGPYPNVTGGFGEQTCRLCHLDNPLNAPGGAVTLEGIPPAFNPGQTYPITVTISRDGLRRGGFEIAARFAAGKQKGRQAGTWRLVDARAQLIPGAVDKALVFVQHNQTGSRAPAPGSNMWTMEWTAPTTSAGAVQFNVAANASNNDDSPLGDYIYVKAIRTVPARGMTRPGSAIYASDNPHSCAHTRLTLKPKDDAVARLKKLALELESAQKAAQKTVAKVQKAKQANAKALRVVDSADRRKGPRRGKKHRAR